MNQDPERAGRPLSCPEHVKLVAAVERMRAILERCAAGTDEMICTVRTLAERIARLETRVSLYAGILGACAGIAGWVVGALVVHWISKE